MFQAKTDSEDRKRLLGQLIKLSTWKEAAFVIRYGRIADGVMLFGGAGSER